MKIYRSPEAAGIPSGAIRAFIDAVDAAGGRLHALMLLDAQGVCYADAAAPYTLDTPHRLCSAAKSMLALGLLKVAEAGRLRLSDRVAELFPEYPPANDNLAALTVEDLLTMRTGQTGDPFPLLFQDFDGDLVEAFFRTPAEEAPGRRFRYNNTVPHIICQVTERAVGEPFEAWFDRCFGAPLEAPLRAPANSKGQYNPVVTSISARAFARYALLFLRRGDWFGQRLLDAEWIDLAVAGHTVTGPDTAGDGYGYQIWRNPFGGYRMDGGWGQYAVVLPERGYAMVVLSDMTRSRPILDAFERTLLPALGTGFDATPPARPPRLCPLAPASEIAPPADWAGTVYRFGEGESVRVLSADGEGLRFELEVGGSRAVYAAGTGGRWLANDAPLWSDTRWSIDTGVYGVEDGRFYLSGAWVTPTAFECVGKSLREMGEHRYRFEFDGNRLRVRHTPGMVHDISSLDGAVEKTGEAEA